jgi:hypothetical protein
MDSQTGSIHRNSVTELYFEGLRSIKKRSKTDCNAQLRKECKITLQIILSKKIKLSTFHLDCNHGTK